MRCGIRLARQPRQKRFFFIRKTHTWKKQSRASKPDIHTPCGIRHIELFEAPDKDRLYLFEEWQDQDALDQHHAQPYTAAVFKSYEGWLAEPPRILPLNGLK
ncbi:antibiotic biosynthesis monooxygenase [Sulfitobacter sp. AS92]|uniref:putative quinol monooxygenase n=1 Tax=Sulfitobacter sp. AS92 TaxID=3135783 RepID=UPI003170D79E